MSEEEKMPYERNLEKMLGEGNEMNQMLMTESIGGNAGYHNGKACFAVNFHYDSHTGEINRFTNTPLNGNGLHLGTFRLIANIDDPETILNIYLDQGSNRFARAVILKTASMYNIAVKRLFDENLQGPFYRIWRFVKSFQIS